MRIHQIQKRSSVSTTISKDNYRHLGTIVELVRSEDVFPKFQFVRHPDLDCFGLDHSRVTPYQGAVDLCALTFPKCGPHWTALTASIRAICHCFGTSRKGCLNLPSGYAKTRPDLFVALPGISTP